MKRPWLYPFTPLYAAVVGWKNKRFDANAEKAARLKWPVISIGSLSAGGAGKSPFVAAMVPLLREMNIVPDILSRGYGRESEEIFRVDPQGLAAQFGDEPLMLARETGAPVYVAAERVRAGRLAEIQLDVWQKRVHLLDDGFQHRQLARNIDIVLLTEEDAKDCVLPAGNLREPLQSLQRADVIVLRAEEAPSLQQTVQRRAKVSAKIWQIRRNLRVAQTSSSPLAFCALARPQQFFSQLAAERIALAKTVSFHDHHAYSASDIAALIKQARAANANGWITTAKDAVKLSPQMLEQLHTVGPVAIADLHVDFIEADSIKRDLASLLATHTGGAR